MKLSGIIGAGQKLVDAARMAAWRMSCRANAVGRKIAPTREMRCRCAWKSMAQPPDTFADRAWYQRITSTPVGSMNDGIVTTGYSPEVYRFAKEMANDLR